MVKVYHAENHLREEVEHLEKQRKGGLGLPIAMVLLTWFLVEHPGMTDWIKDLVTGILGIFLGNAAAYFLGMIAQLAVCLAPVLYACRLVCSVEAPSKKEGVLTGGLVGEEKALKLLRSELNHGSIYTNLKIPNGEGGTNEIDLCVLNNAGLFVVEVKHLSGTVIGDANDVKLRHINRYKDTMFYNPIRQSRTQLHSLKTYLLRRKLDIPLRRCVLFTHDSIKLDITDKENILQYCPVFTIDDLEDFYNYVDPPKKILTDAGVARANQILQRLL